MIATLPDEQKLALADALEGQLEPRVPMRRFLEDPAYLGAESFWPAVKDDLCALYDGGRRYREFIDIEGIGGGKSVKTSILFCYELYDLERLTDPQGRYGLKAGSIIALLNMAPTAAQAKAVIFNEVKQRVESCAWFREHGILADPRIASELHFPKAIRIFPGNSSMTFPLGYNIKVAVIDEAAFYDDTEAADTAEEIHDALSRRMTSRFGKAGGPLVSISSPRYVDDFIETKHALAQDDPEVFAVRRPTWEGKPYPEDAARFEATHPVTGDRVLIPTDFERDFRLNPDKAWRDFGAVPSLVLEPFLQDRAAIRAALHLGNRSLELAWPFAPGVDYAIHVDLAKRRDAAGIAVGYRLGERVVVEAAWRVLCQAQLARRFHGTLPEDTLLAGGEEIDFEIIRDWILRLHQAGCPLVSVSYDGWQSADSLQLLIKQGVPAVELSVDRDLVAYDTLKELLYGRRLDLPDSPILRTELSRLELKQGKKVDHPPKGSKDVADAVAGVCAALIGGQLEGEAEESEHVTQEEALGEDEAPRAQIGATW